MKRSSYFGMSIDHATTLILIGLIIISLALSVFTYNSLPENMASHWNSKGEADGFSHKSVCLFLFPTLLGFITVLYLLIPKIDPLKKNIKSFEKQFGMFIILLSAFFIVIQAQIISWNKSVQVSPNIIMPIAIGIILFYAGILIKHSKRNYFIGIRTPWTLSSDYVWNKTHQFGGIIFRITGVICVLSILINKISPWIILTCALLAGIISIIFSYILYTKHEKSKKSSKKMSKKINSKKKSNKK